MRGLYAVDKKEATVFRVKLSKDQFLRADHSIDLNKARQAVVSELSRVVGEVRDFNGGMISKQNELLCELRSLLHDRLKYNDLLLENFFYSLTPVIMRSVLDPTALQTLFKMLLESIENGLFIGEGTTTKILAQESFAYVMIKSEDRGIKDELNRVLSKLQLHSSELATTYVSVYDMIYLGYIYLCSEPQRQRQFCQTIQQALATCRQKRL